MEGVTSVPDICKPTQADFDSLVLERIEQTAANLDYDPYSTTFAEQESATTNFQGKVVEPEVVSRVPTMVISELTCAGTASYITHDDNFANILEYHVHVSSMRAESLLTSGTVTYYGSKPVDHLTLSKRWSITPESSNNTIRNTNQ